MDEIARGECAVPGWRDLPSQSGARDQPARLPAADRPTPGSLADLRRRLDALDQGHPSSPRAGDPADHKQSGPDDSGLDQDRGPDRVGGPRDRVGGPQDRDGGPQDRDGGPQDRNRNYWTEVPRFEQLWTEHVERWPAAQPDITVDRSRDPEGSWRGSGNHYLSPEQHVRAKDVIGSVRQAEATISQHIREVERDNSCGGRLAGWDFRLKGEDRLKEKIAERIEHEPGRMPTESMHNINDAIRYTFCAEPADYQDSYWSIKGLLEARGYKMIYSMNHWRDDPEYKGINTRWVTPAGQRFGLQFNTAESFHAKQRITHNSYERVRNPLTSDDERGELAAFHREVSSRVSVPAKARDIPEHFRRGH